MTDETKRLAQIKLLEALSELGHEPGANVENAFGQLSGAILAMGERGAKGLPAALDIEFRIDGGRVVEINHRDQRTGRLIGTTAWRQDGTKVESDLTTNSRPCELQRMLLEKGVEAPGSKNATLAIIHLCGAIAGTKEWKSGRVVEVTIRIRAGRFLEQTARREDTGSLISSHVYTADDRDLEV